MDSWSRLSRRGWWTRRAESISSEMGSRSTSFLWLWLQALWDVSEVKESVPFMMPNTLLLKIKILHFSDRSSACWPLWWVPVCPGLRHGLSQLSGRVQGPLLLREPRPLLPSSHESALSAPTPTEVTCVMEACIQSPPIIMAKSYITEMKCDPT